ncbi:hypothetical protein ASG82_22275 [Mycobacterium sp. Soil538]|nr:hypothetical protein ASG82_22275 [Mycobacterium sp. Soil538]
MVQNVEEENNVELFVNGDFLEQPLEDLNFAIPQRGECARDAKALRVHLQSYRSGRSAPDGVVEEKAVVTANIEDGHA